MKILPGEIFVVKIPIMQFWRKCDMRIRAELHENDIITIVSITEPSHSEGVTLFCMTKFGVLERPIPNVMKLVEWIERIV